MASESKMIASVALVAGAAVAFASVWVEARQHQAINAARVAGATTPVGMGATAKPVPAPPSFGNLHANAHLDNLPVPAKAPADFLSVASR